MRILFLTHARGTPSTNWRIAQFVEHWEAQCEIVELDGADLARAAGFDLVVLQKKLPSWWAFRKLRKAARRLIYEFDDAVMLDRGGGGPSMTRSARFSRVVAGADAVTTSNLYLAGLAAEHRDRATIRVFPNAVDPARWKPREPAAKAARVGWFGSPANLEYLRVLAGVIPPGVEFVVVSERPPDVPGAVHVPYDPARENEHVASFDVAVAPMPDTPWTRGKAPVKLLCYMACAVPVIASDVPPHRELIADGQTGFLAASPEEWKRKLGVLLEDGAARARLGRAGRDLVCSNYSTATMARQYLDFYRQVAS